MVEYSYSTVTKKHIIIINGDRKVCDSVEEAMYAFGKYIKERQKNAEAVGIE